jgi:cation diffusion facilitator CzcD-associated flavoprotein CzcO
MSVVVVGAGPAGLAVAACLQKEDLQPIVLERDEVGAAWRRHYERLHLHTDRAHSELPFLGFPRGTPRYPARLEVLAYLERYARAFGIEPLREDVRRLEPAASGWSVVTDRGRHEAAAVVLATGFTRVPVVPRWPGQELFRGEVLHSSAYRSGEAFRGRKVLVVGIGNSGAEIAVDLHEHGARPVIAVRSPTQIMPREFLGLPFLYLAIPMRALPAGLADALALPLIRLRLGRPEDYGLPRAPGGPNRQIRRQGRVPLIDVGTLALLASGQAEVRPGIERFTETGVVFEGGREDPFDAVVLATGFKPRLDELVQLPALDESGSPRGESLELAPGLWTCGMRQAPTGMLREIGREARRIAREVRRRPRRKEPG